MRLVAFILLSFLASCSSDTPQSATETQVHISLAPSSSSAATQAALAGKSLTGSIDPTRLPFAVQTGIPSNVQSLSVQAFSSSGVPLTPLLGANSADFNSPFTVPNGPNIVFKVLAYDNPNAQGTVLYKGKATATLVGEPIDVAVIMSLAINVSASAKTIPSGGSATLTALVGGVAPTAASPIIWSAKVGSFSGNIWTVPTTVAGKQTITAKIDPRTNPDQDPGIVGTIDINVVDQTAPVATAPTSITVPAVNASGTPKTNPIITTFLNAATATDNIGIVRINNNAPVIFPLGTTTVTFVAVDAAGLKGTATSTVTVTDQTPPIITLTGGAAITVALGSTFIDPGFPVTDNVDTGLTATVTGAVNTAALGTYTLTYDVTDTAGNVAITKTRAVTVADLTAPVITLLGVNPYTIAQGATYVDAGSTVTDNVDTSLFATVTGTVNTAIPGTYILTFTASDIAGNTSSLTRTVNVIDQNAPVITVLGANPYTIAHGATYVDPGSSVSDNVDTGLTATVTGTVNTAIIGAYTLTFNVTDTSGNTATPVTRTVNVTDQTPPVITLIGGNPITIDFYSQFTDPGTTVTDNVDTGLTATVTGTVANDGIGLNTLTYNVSDIAGNAATPITRDVYVEDLTAPIIALIGNADIYTTTGVAYVDAGATWTDAFDGSGSITGTGSVDIYTIGTYPITYDITDTWGNVATQVVRNVHVAAPTSIISVQGGTLGNFSPVGSGVEIWTYDLYTMTYNKLGTTDIYGQVSPASLDPTRPYYIGVDTKNRPFGSGYYTAFSMDTGGNVDDGSWDSNPAIYIVNQQPNLTLLLSPGVTFSGTLQDSQGSPIANATIDYWNANNINGGGGFSTYTDGAGNYTTGIVLDTYSGSSGFGYYLFAPGTYLDSFGAEKAIPNGDAGGYFIQPTNSFVEPNELLAPTYMSTAPVSVNAKLIQGTMFKGVVTDSLGSPVQEAEVTNDFGAHTATTDPYGNYELNLAPGSHLIRVSDMIYASGGQDLPLPNQDVAGFAPTASGGILVQNPSTAFTFTSTAGGAAQTVNLQLTAGGTVSGWLEPAGAVYSGTIMLEPYGMTYDGHKLEIPFGASSYGLNAAPGQYLLKVGDPTGVQISVSGFYVDSYTMTNDINQATPITVTAAQTTTANLTLPSGGNIWGTITDPSGSPVVGLDISFESTIDPYVYWTRTNTSGSYSYNVLPSTYRVLINNTITNPITHIQSTVQADWQTGFIDPYGMTDPYATNAATFAVAQLGSALVNGQLRLTNPASTQPFVLPGSGPFDIYAATNGTLWQYGMPTTGPSSTAGITADPYVWATNLTGDYPLNISEYLYLPRIDLTSGVQPLLSMRIWSSVITYDGTVVEAFDPYTSNWNVLTPDPSTPQYETSLVPVVGMAWGNQGAPSVGATAYKLPVFDLYSWNGGVVDLRLAFHSNNTGISSGMYVDEIRVDEEGSNPDGDGLTGILAELSTYGTDPFLLDTDGDGLSDSEETNTGTYVNSTNTGTDPLLSDTDGDGLGDGTEVAQGTNPLLWGSLKTSGVIKPLNDSLWDGLQYVVVGGNASEDILTSPDGATWTIQNNAAGSPLLGVAWNGSTYVAVGWTGAIRTSADAITWTAQTSISTNNLTAVTWSGSQFVAVGGTASSGEVHTSLDGYTWAPSQITSTQYLNAVNYGLVGGVTDTYVTVGNAGEIQTSTDAYTWTARTSGTGNALQAVEWGNNQFVAVGQAGIILTSPDAITWTPRTSPNTTTWLQDILWDGGKYIAVGYSPGSILTSADGITWTEFPSEAAAYISISAGTTSFVLTTNTGAIYTIP